MPSPTAQTERPRLRYGSICSGIEAATVAWEPLGWECAFVSEIDGFASHVLGHRLGASAPVYLPASSDMWGDKIGPLTKADFAEFKLRRSNERARDRFPETSGRITNYGDFTRIGPEAGPIDLLVGGTPCQSFSIAGLRGGLDDDRGNLALEFLKLAGRLRPRWLVWENVPGALSSNGGRDFGSILGGMVELGYGFAYRLLDAQYVRTCSHEWAVPQRRRRVLVVGYLGDAQRAAAVLFDRESLSGNPAPRRKAGQVTSPTLAARTKGGGGLGTDCDLDGGLIVSHDPACTLTARDYKGPLPEADLSTVVARTLRGEGFDASEDGTGRGTPIVPVYTLAERGRNGQQSLECRNDGTANAILTPNGGRGGMGVGAIAYRTTGNDGAYETGDRVDALTTATDPNSHVIAFGSKDHGADASDQVSPTLRASGHSESHANAGAPPAVAFDMRGRDGGAQFEGPHETANIRAAEGGSSRSYIADNYVVRRLMPVECERLQAFPDNWTRIPWNGKPAEDCPDGPRYKTCGNSMATNVMEWIGHRIEMVEAIEAERPRARGGV